jgi:hypothetical protein
VPEGAPGSVRPGALPLGRTAELVGAYRWVELALYRALGEWSVSIPLPEAQLVLAEQSARHAWHAELWADRLPVLDGVDPDALTAPPGPAAPVLAALVGAEDAALPGVLPRLAGLYRVVLPRLVVTYRDHLARTVPATDAPTARRTGGSASGSSSGCCRAPTTSRLWRRRSSASRASPWRRACVRAWSPCRAPDAVGPRCDPCGWAPDDRGDPPPDDRRA